MKKLRPEPSNRYTPLSNPCVFRIFDFFISSLNVSLVQDQGTQKPKPNRNRSAMVRAQVRYASVMREFGKGCGGRERARNAKNERYPLGYLGCLTFAHMKGKQAEEEQALQGTRKESR